MIRRQCPESFDVLVWLHWGNRQTAGRNISRVNRHRAAAWLLGSATAKQASTINLPQQLERIFDIFAYRIFLFARLHKYYRTLGVIHNAASSADAEE